MFAPEHIFFIVITFGHLLFSDMKSKIVDGGKVEVRLPFEIEDGRLAEEYKVVYINTNGENEEVESVYIDGAIVVTLEHFSEYAIIDTVEDSIMTTAMIIIASILGAFAVFTVAITIVFIRKERDNKKHKKPI